MDFRDFVAPFIVRQARKRMPRSSATILDVGCGPYSPVAMRRVFPDATYHALDIVEPEPHLHHLIDQFYRLDLTKADFSTIKDSFYDAIVLSHVIEHVPNGEDVIRGFAPKLKAGGVMAIEFPSWRSLGLPSGQGTLQFCDDETHVKVYDVRIVANAMLAAGIKVVDGGRRRDMIRVLCSPLAIPLQIKTLLTEGTLHARGLWDILGFADFVVGVRKA
jgi:hypothetical protein